MALMDDPSDNKDFIKAMTYLGKGPFNIGMPGGADLNVGAGPAPAPGVNVGTFGQKFGLGGGPGGAAESGAVGPGGSAGSSGSDILGLLQKFLTAGGKTADFASRLGGDPTRGTIGGDNTTQDSNTSLSDQLRSASGPTGLSAADMAALESGGLNLQGTQGLSGATVDEMESLLGGGGAAGAAGDLSGLSSGLGAGASGAGALAAILGAIASATGEQDLGKAASALGGAGTAAGTAGAGAAAAEGTAGLAGAAALGASPVAAGLLIGLIGQLTGNEDLPFQIGPAPDPYAMFGEKLGNTLGTENTGLQGLYGALPSVNSQQQLQQLLDSFKATEAGRIGGYGQGSDPFSVPGLPGAGGSAHEWGANADFGVPTDQLNQAIQGLLGYLPATSPEGTMPGSQLWNTEMTNLDRTRARNTGLNLDQLATMSPEDQAATMALFPENIAMPGASDPWTQYMQSLQPRPQAAPTQTAAVAAPPPSDPFAMTDPYQDWLARQGTAG